MSLFWEQSDKIISPLLLPLIQAILHTLHDNWEWVTSGFTRKLLQYGIFA